MAYYMDDFVNTFWLATRSKVGNKRRAHSTHDHVLGHPSVSMVAAGALTPQGPVLPIADMDGRTPLVVQVPNLTFVVGCITALVLGFPKTHLSMVLLVAASDAISDSSVSGANVLNIFSVLPPPAALSISESRPSCSSSGRCFSYAYGSKQPWQQAGLLSFRHPWARTLRMRRLLCCPS